ncbi:MAG: DegT/DnrJ/EryC1/StrS family aminotransferase [Bacteroidetes bacterium]|nr:DegT/DnrJ/EryC1/StrS family aminotransferase [Bacteroidota bacterium]
MLFVTEPFLPPMEEYQHLLKGIWERNHLTNNGPLVLQLEDEVPRYLSSVSMLYLSNGTIALQIALKALGITKEVITTPFSYVATTSSIVWEGCTPVFADIDPETWNISPEAIEACITEHTQAILATHVFGNPCDVKAIQAIADRHGLKVIYDAAHAFGSMVEGRSVFDFGHISTASFHATKVFHTIEGGAIFSAHSEVLHRVGFMRNFGHNGPEKFDGVGINGKNSEFHAAMGVLNLKYIDRILVSRKAQCALYDHLLKDHRALRQQSTPGASVNHSYYALLFESEASMMNAKDNLEQNGVMPRRYFYPSLNKLDYVQGQAPVSEDVSERILCLPLFHAMTESDQEKIADIVLKSQES